GGGRLGGVASGVEGPGAAVEVVGAQHQDRIVQLARHRERPPFVSRGVDGVGGGGDVLPWREHGDRRGALFAVDLHVDVVVVIAGGGDRALGGVGGDSLSAAARALRRGGGLPGRDRLL